MEYDELEFWLNFPATIQFQSKSDIRFFLFFSSFFLKQYTGMGIEVLRENESGYYGDQFAASQCTEIVKIFFFFCLEVEASEPTYHYFLFHTNHFLKLPA